jgi:hypothetical protein
MACVETKMVEIIAYGKLLQLGLVNKLAKRGYTCYAEGTVYFHGTQCRLQKRGKKGGRHNRGRKGFNSASTFTFATDAVGFISLSSSMRLI